MAQNRKIIFFLLVATGFFSSPSCAETLHIGASDWRPWIVKNGDSFTGITVEICKEAIKRAGHDSAVLEMPTKRLLWIEWGRKTDVEPGCEKSWREDFKDVSVYTDPFIETRNVVVSRKGSYPVTDTVKTFYGEKIGCNLGYYYTDGFSEALDQGKIIRDDCGTGHNLISKLINNRYKAAIADTYEWKYWMQEMGYNTWDFEESYLFSHPNNLRIRLHISKKHLIDSLNKALESMESDKTIDKIVKTFIKD